MDEILVPRSLLESLRREYLEGNCPIRGGWGDSPTIESLMNLLDHADELEEAAWLWGFLGYEESQPWSKRTPAMEQGALNQLQTLKERFSA